MFDFGLYTQVSDSGPQGPLVLFFEGIFLNFNRVMPGNEMVKFCVGVGGGWFWHFSATYNVVLLK